MSISARLTPKHNFTSGYMSQGQFREPEYEPSHVSSWEVTLSLSRMVVLWSMICGLMVMVFVFGFHAGKSRAISNILANRGDVELARLPIVKPIISKELSSVLVNKPLIETRETSLESPANISKTSDPLNKDEYDFSQKKSLPSSLEEKPVAENIKVVEEVVKPAVSKITEKKVVSSEIPSSVSKGWYVQVVAAPSEAIAKTTAQKLNGSGFKSAVEKASVRNINYYRVLVGPYSSRDSANSQIARIRSLNPSKASPFIRNVQ